MSSEKPTVGFIGVGNMGWPMAACLANGAELFLEKPSTSEGVKLAFNMLNDILLWTQQNGFSGALQHVSLPDVIQLECLNKKSLVLDVRNAMVRGQIFIEAGKIIHATTGNLNGEKAFQELLSLAGGQFQLQPFRQPPEHTVTGHWEFLLMEAARVHDEMAVTPAPAKPAPALPPPPVSTPLQVAPPPPAVKPLKPAEVPMPVGVPSENIVIIDGDEDKWLSLGGSQTGIHQSSGQ